MALRTLVLAPADASAVEAGTGARPAGPPQTERRTYVDTFDGRLHAAGQEALAGDAIDPALQANRALLPLVRLQVTAQPLVLRDDEGGIILRLTCLAPVVEGPDGSVPLPGRVELREVRGYPKAFDRAERKLREGGLGDPGMLAAEAARAIGRDPAGVSAKVAVDLPAGMPAGEAAGRLLLRLADIAEAHVPGVLADHDVEFLHDLRVAVRRARSVLRELRDVFPSEALAALRAELKWVQAVTGPVRDLDVQLEDLDTLARTLPAARQADLEPLRALLREERVRALRELKRVLRGPRFAAALAHWRVLAVLPPATDAWHTPIEDLSGTKIRSVYRRMRRDGARIGEDSPDEALHDLRKRGKELRYLLELLGDPFDPAAVKPLVKALKGLQDVLGRFQDRAVQAELLRALVGPLAARPGGPEALLALGLVLEELRRDQLAARTEFEDAFAAFTAKDRRRRVRRSFGG